MANANDRSGERAALEQMVAVMDEHGLDALTVRVGDVTYELERRADPPAVVVAAAIPGAAALAAPEATTPAAPGAAAQPAANVKRVTAPIVGVFYRAPSPGAESFVEAGDRVSVGQTLCILEAMKLMNEITSDHAGVVKRILPENGALVSLGEDLFWIEP